MASSTTLTDADFAQQPKTLTDDDFQQPADKPGALSRFGGALGETLNPVNVAEGAVRSITHPLHFTPKEQMQPNPTFEEHPTSFVGKARQFLGNPRSIAPPEGIDKDVEEGKYPEAAGHALGTGILGVAGAKLPEAVEGVGAKIPRAGTAIRGGVSALKENPPSYRGMFLGGMLGRALGVPYGVGEGAALLAKGIPTFARGAREALGKTTGTGADAELDAIARAGAPGLFKPFKSFAEATPEAQAVIRAVANRGAAPEPSPIPKATGPVEFQTPAEKASAAAKKAPAPTNQPAASQPVPFQIRSGTRTGPIPTAGPTPAPQGPVPTGTVQLAKPISQSAEPEAPQPQEIPQAGGTIAPKSVDELLNTVRDKLVEKGWLPKGRNLGELPKGKYIDRYDVGSGAPLMRGPQTKILKSTPNLEAKGPAALKAAQAMADELKKGK